MLKQISVFAENKKGMLEKITGVLLRADINIWGSVASDSAEYGVIRMIVSDPDLAAGELAKEGFLCKVTDVLGVEVADEVGNLNRLLQALRESNINVDYIYLSFNRDSSLPVMVLRTDDICEVEECLQMKGFSVL